MSLEPLNAFDFLQIFDRYITQESHKLEIQVRPPSTVTNAVSWRSEGVKYRKNEVRQNRRVGMTRVRLKS